MLLPMLKFSSWRRPPHETLTLTSPILSIFRLLTQSPPLPDHIHDPAFSLTSNPKDNVKKKKKKENGESKKGQTFPFKSDLPFDFRYSYSEANPSVHPIGFREPPRFSPFGPARLDRKWTGTAAPAEEVVDPAVVSEQRKAVLGEPLSEDEIAELVERYRHSDCSRQINLGKFFPCYCISLFGRPEYRWSCSVLFFDMVVLGTCFFSCIFLASKLGLCLIRYPEAFPPPYEGLVWHNNSLLLAQLKTNP